MKKHQQPMTYTLMHVLLASPVNPMPESTRSFQLLRMWSGLAALEKSEKPTADDWRVCSDAVNIMESLVEMGEIEDSTGLLKDAVAALALAGRASYEGLPLRLSGEGMVAMRAVLEDYASCLEELPARTMIKAHCKTEWRVREILAGKKLPHDVTVMAI